MTAGLKRIGQLPCLQGWGVPKTKSLFLFEQKGILFKQSAHIV